MRFAKVAVLTLLLSLSAWAGDAPPSDAKPAMATGMVPYTAFGGVRENINYSNGNLNLNVPLVGLSGRNGHEFTLSLVYDSKIWTPRGTYMAVPPGGYIEWIWGREFSGYNISGWHLNIPYMYSSAKDPYYGNCRFAFVAIMPDGSKHAFGNGGSPSDFSCPTYTDAQDGSFMSLDTSNASEAVVYMKNGTRIHFPGNTGPASKVVDTNGNIINFQQQQDGSITVTDTLGRVITVGAKANNQQLITYKNSSGTTKTITLQYQAFDGSWAPGTTPFNWPHEYHIMHPVYPEVDVLQPNDTGGTHLWKITLPDNLGSFTFDYNKYSELKSVQYPSGGETKYGYTGDVFAPTSETLPMYYVCTVGGSNFSGKSDFRQLLRRAVTTTPGSNYAITKYEPYTSVTADPSSRCGASPVNNQTMQVRDAQLNRTSYEFFYSGNGAGQEKKRQVYQGESQLLRTVEQAYTVYSAVETYPLPWRSTTTLDDNQQSRVEYSYDTYSASIMANGTYTTTTAFIDNPTLTVEYAYGLTTVLRKTANSWLKTNPVNSINYFSGTEGAYKIHIRDRKLGEDVKDGNDVLKASTTHEYDNYAQLSWGRPASGAIQHETRNYSGNVTKTQRWRDPGNTWLPTYLKFDDAGNILTIRDPGGHDTQFGYTDNWANTTCSVGTTKAHLTSVTNALGHVSTTAYNSCTSTVAAKTDPNNRTTTFTYDAVDRLDLATFPDGGSKDYSYPTPNSMRVDTANGQSVPISSTTIVDGLGRTSQKQINSAVPYPIYQDTYYDAVGRPWKTSAPYYTNDQGKGYITRTDYDALSRVTTVTTEADGNYSANSYSGNWTTSYDQAGRGRIYKSDALGQLSTVIEPNATTGAWENYTNYVYDVLGNLTYVEQRGNAASSEWRIRTFTYNSLSQLLTANNPESGLITYTYDNDGNVTTKIDARGVITCYGTLNGSACTPTYDALHRLMDKTFSDGTPNAAFRYDASTTWGVTNENPIGRLTLASANLGSIGTIYSYDVMGRPKKTWECLTSGCSVNEAGYNLDGSMAWLKYPDGRKVAFGYDTAARQNKLSFESFGGTTVNYDYWTVPSTCPASLGTGFIGEGFHPSGAARCSQLGSGVVEGALLNNRLQPQESKVVNGGTTHLDRTYAYGTANNGNIMGIADVLIPGRSQNFTYDQLNRITAAYTDATTGAYAWGQSYTIDPWGNLTKQLAYDGTRPNPSPLDQSATAQNRLTGYGYDAAGNLTQNGSTNYAYDGENRITTTLGYNYTYDANGQRVRKSDGTNWTEYIYFGGNVIAEKDQAGAWTDYIFAGGKRVAKAPGVASTSGTQFYHADHLGSARLMTDASGTPVPNSDATFLPFGQEFAATSTSNHYKFTGKERDGESGLDNFGARYDSSSMGRFITPDFFANDTHPADPQSWNLYGYVRNNPLRFTDPDGEKVYVGDVTGSDRDELLKRTNATYGCESCVSVDKDGYLAVDTTGLSADVQKATADLTGAINSTDWFAQVKVSNNDDKVAFGETRPVRGAVPWNGVRRNADLIVLDLADNKQIHGDKLSGDTFANTVLAHEILHRYPAAISDPQGGAAYRNTGPVVDAVNRITNALGLPARASYSTHPFISGTRAQTYVQTKGGKEQQTIIYWQKNIVGGKD